MPDGVFRVAVVTPESALLEGPARAVMLRSSDGDLTVLDGHTPLITDVVPGLVRVEQEEGDPVRLAVHGGYLQVETGPSPGDEEPSRSRSTRVTLLAGVAERAEDIDVARAEHARDQASARLEELRSGAGRAGGDGASESGESGERAIAESESALHRAELRLEVAGAAS